MSIAKIHLRKLLVLFYLPDNKRKTLLRSDIRESIKKENGESGTGGDFHGPFWADAKAHAIGQSELRNEVKHRVASNRTRARLYPELAKGFLNWWDERRRWKNEPFKPFGHNIISRRSFPELKATVKVENLLALKIGDQSNRIIYPYFSEVPELSEDGARLGLWLLGEALSEYDQEDIRLLDVMRSKSYGISDVPLRGNEAETFSKMYESILTEWHKLSKEYGLKED